MDGGMIDDHEGNGRLAPIPKVEALTQQDHAGLAKAFNDMQAKMRITAQKGRNGWHDPVLCPAPRLRLMLRAAVKKGDAVDVLNFAMMLNARGEPTHVEGEDLRNLYAENTWYQAVADCCDIAHLTPHLDNPRQTINDLINWHVMVSLDPKVSSDAAALIEEGKKAGRAETASHQPVQSWDETKKAMNYEAVRVSVPGGWLLCYRSRLTFIHDPNHEWE